MSELEDRVDELERENEELRDKLSDLEGRFEAFAKPCAIGSEQLWEVVFNDILKRPVPSGVDLRDLV
jgi:nucleosome binding factor SPN SPT16 subunit|tara:strand:- start:999 stop:1199 length:201 start_codon:yes stop_codon:yes gene_type:complete